MDRFGIFLSSIFLAMGVAFALYAFVNPRGRTSAGQAGMRWVTLAVLCGISTGVLALLDELGILAETTGFWVIRFILLVGFGVGLLKMSKHRQSATQDHGSSSMRSSTLFGGAT